MMNEGRKGVSYTRKGEKLGPPENPASKRLKK